ncbi:hypothetical protein RJT34_12233 [Clitoria ternatea]|uniref:ATPase AAA-type core domain-containing protein n=1 Tax=Clitoria ternatea TaxID=43366 RepID=A0AAN9PJ49_CLITE
MEEANKLWSIGKSVGVTTTDKEEDLIREMIELGAEAGISDGSGDDDDEHVELEKSNVLLIGPTGPGKTFFVKSLARFVNVPFVIADVTTLTQKILLALYLKQCLLVDMLSLVNAFAAKFNVQAAQQGIVYIDEVDRITRKWRTRETMARIEGTETPWLAGEDFDEDEGDDGER